MSTVTSTRALPELPAIVHGTVAHRRRRPVRNGFRHGVYQWLVDLDRLPRMPWFLRPAAGFDARDHLGRDQAAKGLARERSAARTLFVAQSRQQRFPLRLFELLVGGAFCHLDRQCMLYERVALRVGRCGLGGVRGDGDR